MQNNESGKISQKRVVYQFGPETGNSATERKYSPVECTGAKKTVVCGQPDEKFISAPRRTPKAYIENAYAPL